MLQQGLCIACNAGEEADTLRLDSDLFGVLDYNWMNMARLETDTNSLTPRGSPKVFPFKVSWMLLLDL